MLGIFYSSLPSSLSCRTFMCISRFCRKVSSFRFVRHFALRYICFLLFFTVTWFLFLGESPAFSRPVPHPSWWSLPYPCLGLGGCELPSFFHPCSYTHGLFCMCWQMHGFWVLKSLSGSHMHSSPRPHLVTC